MAKKDLVLKVYRFRIDTEDKKGYFENQESFDILAETIDEAIEVAKKRISKDKYDVIGEIELLSIID